ncbi:MAG: hypothetical protein ACKO7P_03690 [Bacteroidota bacterium]
MNKVKLILACSSITCLMLQSCENESRLNEIKKELESSTGVRNNDAREKVSLSAPSLNKPAPVPTDYSYDGYYGDGGYYGYGGYYGDDYNYNVPDYEYYSGD